MRQLTSPFLDLRFRVLTLRRSLTNGHMHAFSLSRAVSNQCVSVNTLSLSRTDTVISRSGSPHDASHLPSKIL